MRQTLLLLLAILIPPTTVIAADKPNLLLITLDTTRADHLSVYGYEQPTTPNLDELGSQGVRFETAYTPVGLTGPAHATMLTGLYPHRHGAVRNGIRLSKEVPTLGEILGERGYSTAAFVSGWTLKRKLSGLDRGFDVYDDDMSRRTRVVTSERDGRITADAALAWLKAHADRPFFMWVHFFDPHVPYRRHRDAPIRGDHKKIVAYDTELHYVDAQVSRLLDELDRLQLAARTLVVLTADHGESLGEHGAWGHSFSVAPEVLHVPLILRWPGRLPEGRLVRGPVSLVDLFATIGSLLDVGTLPSSQGVDLAPLAFGPRHADPARVTWFAAYPGVVRRTFKFLSKRSPIPLKAGYREGDSRWVWDIKKDVVRVQSPEANSAAATTVRGKNRHVGRLTTDAHADRVRAAVRDWLRSRLATLEDDQIADLTDDDLERLEGLGYLP